MLGIDRPHVGFASRANERPGGCLLGLGGPRPLVIGPANVPEVTDPEVATREPELAVLSAVAHGNGDNGLAVAGAALVALSRLDREHAVVGFHVIWNGLREPMRRALEALVMERQTEGKATILPFMQDFFESGERKGLREGELKGLREGELKGLREALLGLLAHVGIALTEDEHVRVHTCTDATTLHRWVENVLGAKTAADVLS